MDGRIVRDYVAQYPDPIVVGAGQRVPLVRQDDEYPGWWWCVAPDGRQGWVPTELLNIEDNEATMRRDYDAHELTVSAGEVVNVLEQVAAWARVTNRAGRTGWVPVHCLTITDIGA
jgi:SH3-like domain-containing protein